MSRRGRMVPVWKLVQHTEKSFSFSEEFLTFDKSVGVDGWKYLDKWFKENV